MNESELWQQTLRDTGGDLTSLAHRFDWSAEKLARLEEVARVFHYRATPYYLSLIEHEGDAIYRQCVPDERELQRNEGLSTDPLGENEHTPVPSVVHRYPDRCLLLASNECAMYCRFCTRKRLYAESVRCDATRIEAGIDYIRSRPEIRDVLISGGDPFLLDDERLDAIVRSVRAIRHVEIIRIGTRTPCVLPERITPRLVARLQKHHPLFVNVHFNHPAELTPRAIVALARLADAGIPLGCQTVLLRGVNDDPFVIRELMRRLLAARVRPYYLSQSDLVCGTHHFRTPLATGLAIIDALRGWTSGLAIPHFVVDLPGGRGKVALVPESVIKVAEGTFTFRTYRGELCQYTDVTDGTPCEV